MKQRFVPLLLVCVLSFAGCIKYVVPIPPPPGGSGSTALNNGGGTPYGFSMVINGLYSTYNSYSSVDTTNNGFNYMATGDSSCCTNIVIAWGINKFDNTPLTTGIYPSSGFDLENQSDWTLYDYNTWGYTPDVGFGAFPDSVIVTNITDTTITGTFSGTCTAKIMSDSVSKFGPVYYDSTILVTNGKFYLQRN